MKYVDKINPCMNLDIIKEFCDSHGNLANSLNNVIHVAGTNGKGSTVAFLRYILEANRYSVNVFTSPHLVNENERIRIRGKLISEEYNNKLDNFINNDSIGKKLSIFEKYVAKAVIAFNEFPADFTILEVGLGGRLDATNLIDKPLVSIITPIDFDHQHILGNTLTAIAGEKAAIIKKNCLVVSAYQNDEVLDVIKNGAVINNSTLIIGGVHWTVESNGKNYLQYKGDYIALDNLGLQGKHQLYNASLAIVALKEVLGNKLSTSSISLGLENVQWPGRLQKIDNKLLYNYTSGYDDLILLDGAHNTHGANALLDYIKHYCDTRKIYMIVAMLRSKNLSEYLTVYKNLKNFKLYSVTLPKDFDAFSSNEIKQIADNLGINAVACLSPKQALSCISKEQGNKLIIICGSLYLIGKILEDNNIKLN